MAEWICENCEEGFTRKRSKGRPTRFCSQKCYHLWRKKNGITTGQFKKGLIPWNKDLKGIHLSPGSEFKKGDIPKNKLSVGSVQIRQSKKRKGHPRAYIKTAEPNIWRLRCHTVWERHFGEIPKGMLIHHIDRDTLNDEITNLAGVSRSRHMQEHRPEFDEKRLINLRKSLCKKRDT